MAAAAVIVGRLRREKGVTVRGLMGEYGCGHNVLMDVVFSVMTFDEWVVIRNKHLAAGGAARRFKKGHKAWNEGRKGLCYPGSVATQFKKGQIRGSAARKYRPVGSVTLRNDNGKQYRWIKVKDDGSASEKYVPLARYRWEKVNGPLPDGMFVVHEDGDTLNDEPGNLVAVGRKGNLKLQNSRDPGMEERRKENAAKAQGKKDVNRKRGQSLRAAAWARKNRQVGVVWDCYACGCELQQKEKPVKCAKCGSFAMVKVEGVVARATARPARATARPARAGAN
jgi:DNA-directed RNA polymerase subunit RPC12/RpoP